MIQVFALTLLTFGAKAQQTLYFQGNETGNNWSFTGTGASATGITESQLAPNRVSGTSSLVAGGTSGGGSCIDGGSGNGASILHQFTFSSVDISSSSNFTRTLTFHYGNRFPVCVGTGWDSGENLIFTPILDGVAQTPITLVTGSNNLSVNIQNTSYSYSIPTCILEFGFTIGISTNRNDEFLFVDNVALTSPQLNSANPSLGPISGPTQICEGTNSSTYSVAAINASSYTWSGLPVSANFTTPNGTVNSTQMSVNWGNTQAGNYTLQVIPQFQNCGQTVNGTAQQIQIEVSASGTLNMSPNMEICAGENTTISVLDAGTFSWSNGLSNGTQHTVSPSETTTYTATGAIQGCSASGSITVTVKPNPSIQLQASATTVCPGGQVAIQANGADSYIFPNDPTVTPTGLTSFTVNPVSTSTFTVEGTTNGCTSSQSITIQISGGANIQAGNDTTICAGTSAQLQASGGVQYQWDLGGIQNGTVSPNVTTTYTVVGMDALGCVGQDSKTIFVEAAPEATIDLSNQTGCIPFQVNAEISGNQTNVNWQIGNQQFSSNSILYTMNQTSCVDIVVEISSTNGCSTIYTLNDVICASAAPVADFETSISEITSENGTVQFTNQSSDFTNQTWQFGDGNMSDESNPTHTYNTNSEGYWITLFVENEFGCTDEIRKYIPVTSISGIYVPNAITPDGNEFNQTFKPVFTSDFDIYNFELKIFDRWGHVVFVTQDPSIGWDGTNTSGYLAQSGVYIWKMNLKKANTDQMIETQGHVQLIH